MISLSALQSKEVVLLGSGKRLGFISDFEMDIETGVITAFIISTKAEGTGLFNRMVEKVVPWEQIITIGTDLILIDEENRGKIDSTDQANEPLNDES